MTFTDETRRKQSALMTGPVVQIQPPDKFPFENVLLARDRYDYEGNWLFCVFDQPEIAAARIGFGLGKFHWQDYGLEVPQETTAPIVYRLEVVIPAGVHACLYSDPHQGTAVQSDPAAMEIKFRANELDLFRLRGWPQMSWQFRNQDASITADLLVSLKAMAVWPDCIMQNNTFSMCIGVCGVSGAISLGDKRIAVTGGAVYDHPRVAVRPNAVAPFGWYLYAPIRFPDGTFVVSYYAEDGLGKKDGPYSTGFIILPDGGSRWLNSVQVRRLKTGEDGNPMAWEAELAGEGVSISYRTRIAELASIDTRAPSSPDRPSGKYLAFPLLMDVEGECRMDGVTKSLDRGSGISEFLARKGHTPVFP